MTKWRELEAQGVKRCCAMFTNGKRCRRRVSSTRPFASWCEKHEPVMEAFIKEATKILRRAK